MSSRRKPTPWIHRWSRPLIGAVAGLGALNTGYLTANALLGGNAACPTSGCQQVLSSQYAQVFGLPLSLFGFLAYAGILALALAPLAVNPDKNKPLRNELENWTWLLLFLGSTAMLIFSGYLMFIMATKFIAVYGADGICIYCIASALFALTIFILTLVGRAWEDIGQLVFSGVIVAMVTLVGTGVLYSLSNPRAASTVAGEVGPAVTTVSGPSEIALAQHLTSIGAKMYSAFWCPHCHEQKQLFGAEAAKQIPLVECDPSGQNAQTALCQSKSEVRGYPTWEINGQFYSGTQSLQQLADYSNYQGPRDFRTN